MTGFLKERVAQSHTVVVKSQFLAGFIARQRYI